jgi:hypothetical protein
MKGGGITMEFLLFEGGNAVHVVSIRKDRLIHGAVTVLIHKANRFVSINHAAGIQVLTLLWTATIPPKIRL